MAGSIINQNGSSSITVTNLIEILEGERLGFNAISMTNMSTTSVSAIAAGSVCEIGGSLYQFSTEEPISTSNITSTSAMTYYVELVPSSSECTAQFSSVVPAWRNDYYGWYESTSLNYRVVAKNYFNGTSYSTDYKYYLNSINVQNPNEITPGSINGYINVFNTIFKSTGTMSTTNNYIAYPSSYDMNNTKLLTFHVKTTTSPGIWHEALSYGDNSTGYTLHVFFDSTHIRLQAGSNYYNWYYEILFYKSS